jgi:polysaccharide export outer membrane protein
MSRPIAPRLLALGLAASLCACASSGPDLFSPKVQPTAAFPNIAFATWRDSEPAYRLYPGDEIQVQAPSAPELTTTATVQPDGRIALPLIEPVMVAMRTLPDAEAMIGRAYASQLIDPRVHVAVKTAPLKVFVGGEVDKPGVYDMPGDIDALQAVILAGGFKPSARRGQVVVIRRGADGRAMMRTVDLRRGLSDPGGNDAVPLRRFDVVYVPRTSISEAGLFVQQYIRDLVPFDINYSAGPTYLGVSGR